MDGVTGVLRQAGVVQRRDPFVSLQPGDDASGVGLALFHADLKGFHAPQGQEGILRPQTGAEGVLDIADAIAQILVLYHGKTADHVAVAVEELGAAVQDDITPQIQGALQVGGHEGVVHQGDDAVSSSDFDGTAQIGDLQQRIGRGLQIDPFGFRSDGGFNGGQVGGIHEG